MKKHVFLTLLLLLGFPWVVYSGDYDDVSQVKTPNVMIIFDTSSSMDKQPNGSDQGVGYMCIKNDGSGDYTVVVGSSCPAGYTKYYFESGGNHPNSKLYQAKKALREIVESVVKDKVNLGFSTYAQFKTERRRGKYSYTKNKYSSKRYWAYYKKRNSYDSYSFQSNAFKDVWGITRNNISKNSTFTYATKVYKSGLTFPPHPPSTEPSNLVNLQYTVTGIKYEAEFNRYKFSYRSDPFDWYAETTFNIDPCASCSTDTVNNPFPATKTSGTDALGNPIVYRTYFSGSAEYANPTGGRAANFW
ncbi:MAG: hypothetical protein EHM36_14010, partial [Deltaproteobacteria bacterium]